MQEGLPLADGQRATICTIRDPYAGAIIASQAFDTTKGSHWHKLTDHQVQSVLRSAFAEWHTLPAGVQTDNEVCLGGSPTDPFPSRLSLWLAGLGVVHQFIRPHCPTDQAQVERSHRTLQGWLVPTEAFNDQPALQKALDEQRYIYNQRYRGRAAHCAGLPPLLAHPGLRVPRHAYTPEQEVGQFSWPAVYNYLAQFSLLRRVSSCGRISVGRQYYQLGRRYAGQQVVVQCLADEQEWLVSRPNGEELRQFAIKGLTTTTLLGEPTACQPGGATWQLPLPGLAA
jgi:putative transposase